MVLDLQAGEDAWFVVGLVVRTAELAACPGNTGNDSDRSVVDPGIPVGIRCPGGQYRASA